MLLQYITIKFPTNKTGQENIRKRSRNGDQPFYVYCVEGCVPKARNILSTELL